MSEMESFLNNIGAGPLKPADRCDQCSSQAMIRVIFGVASVLDFCKHHFDQHRLVLEGEYGASIAATAPELASYYVGGTYGDAYKPAFSR